MQDQQTIAVIQDKAVYCDIPPYDPSEAYPEYPFKARSLSPVDNPAYRAVRQAFAELGLDSAHYGSAEWNPLCEIVPVGGTVVIKPNLVMDRHYAGGNIYAVITHPSMIRAVADYCRIALGASGRIVVADAPVEDCDFAHLRQFTHLDDIAGVFREAGGQFEIRDLRRYQSPAGEKRNYAYHRTPLAGDPCGDVRFDLGGKSALCEKPGPFFGADAAVGETQEHHHNGVHRYSVSGTVLSCDTLISMPKLKVHKKVGVTLNLKGMVGVNTNKNFLVHYTLGTPRSGGDEAPDLKGAGENTVFWMRRLINTLFFQHHHPVLERLHEVIFHSKIYVAVRGFLRKRGLQQSPKVESSYGGNWYGNDSCWRMVADLAWIVRYGNKEGRICDTPQRRLFSVVDGIVGGDRNAPLQPRERPVGVVIAGENLAAVDMVCTRLMGFDYLRLPLYRWLLARGERRPYEGLDEVKVVSHVAEFQECMSKPGRYLGFEPHKNWEGHLEMHAGQNRPLDADGAEHSVVTAVSAVVPPGNKDAAGTAATTKGRETPLVVTAVSAVPLRICHIVTSLRIGGMERMVCDLIGGLRTQGIESVLCCTDETGELYESVPAAAKFCGQRKAGILAIDWKLVRQMVRIVRDNKVTVMHAHNPVAHLHAVGVSWFTGIPVVATWHGQGYTDTARVLFLKRLLAGFSKRVILVSEDSKKGAVANGSVSEGKAIVIPNGIDTGVFRPRNPESRIQDPESRSKVGIPADAVVIGSVGRLSPEKNYPLLVRAFGRVVAGKTSGPIGFDGAKPSISLMEGAALSAPLPQGVSHLTSHISPPHLLLIGDGPDRGRIEAEIERLNLKDCCHIAGMQTGVLTWLQALDIFCLSSDTEGLSISLLEAGACGLPSVVTDAGGNREIVNDGLSGFVVPVGDEAALAKGLERLMVDVELRRKMGAVAREIVEARYSLAAMVVGYVKVYEQVGSRLTQGGDGQGAENILK